MKTLLAQDKELVWIKIARDKEFACLYHVLKVMISDVINEMFGTSVGPDVNIFKRFQKQWLEINQENFQICCENLFNTENLFLLTPSKYA